MVDGEVEAAVQEQGVAVGALELCEGRAALDVSWVAGDGDQVVGDHVVGEQVEEVVSVDEPGQALLDDPEERVDRGELVQVLDRHRAPPQAVRASVRQGRRPGRRGSPGEIEERGRGPPGDILDAVIRPGPVAGGDGLGEDRIGG